MKLERVISVDFYITIQVLAIGYHSLNAGEKVGVQ
jgi:hypothetical protein